MNETTLEVTLSGARLDMKISGAMVQVLDSQELSSWELGRIKDYVMCYLDETIKNAVNDEKREYMADER